MTSPCSATSHIRAPAVIAFTKTATAGQSPCVTQLRAPASKSQPEKETEESIRYTFDIFDDQQRKTLRKKACEDAFSLFNVLEDNALIGMQKFSERKEESSRQVSSADTAEVMQSLGYMHKKFSSYVSKTSRLLAKHMPEVSSKIAFLFILRAVFKHLNSCEKMKVDSFYVEDIVEQYRQTEFDLFLTPVLYTRCVISRAGESVDSIRRLFFKTVAQSIASFVQTIDERLLSRHSVTEMTVEGILERAKEQIVANLKKDLGLISIDTVSPSASSGCCVML